VIATLAPVWAVARHFFASSELSLRKTQGSIGFGGRDIGLGKPA
jgi:hypothetical protein